MELDRYEKILWLLGRMDGELGEIRKLPERVSMLEQGQSWLKGGWVILVAAWGYLFKALYGR